jgi:Protein of unknown function (DUF1353)
MNAAGSRFTLLEVETYRIGSFGFDVPAGYTTDFESTPPWVRSFFPHPSRASHAAVLHDWLYDCHHKGFPLCDRKTADWILREQMKIDGVGFRTRWTFWIFVRLFGWSFWDKKES